MVPEAEVGMYLCFLIAFYCSLKRPSRARRGTGPFGLFSKSYMISNESLLPSLRGRIQVEISQGSILVLALLWKISALM